MKKAIAIPKLQTDSFLIDSHCHLDMSAYDEDIENVLIKAQENGIKYVITIGIDLESSHRGIEIAKKYSMVFSTIGVHPHDVDNITDITYVKLSELYKQNSKYIVGYGEIGLDYYKQYSSIEQQKKHLKHQLNLAKDLNLPIIIHNREAEKDMIPILKSAAPFPKGGVMHCFSGDHTFAMQVLDLGLHISIPGVVTFKNAQTLRDVVKTIPITSLLLETDGPFLAPHPYRGKRNEPLYVLFTAAETAKTLQISIDDLARQTSINAMELFNLPSPERTTNDY